jgi:hypothetical protein
MSLWIQYQIYYNDLGLAGWSNRASSLIIYSHPT